MKRLGGFAALILVMASSTVAHADDAVRVIIAGPKKDPIAARLEKELVALGFAPIAVGPMPDCTAPSVGDAVKNAGASAALCSNGERIAVWTDDGTDVKLRDTVSTKGAQNDTVAMKAAEVMRANIAFREPEPVKPVNPPPARPAMSNTNWDDFESQDKVVATPIEGPRYAPKLGFSAGATTLASAAGSASGLSFGASYGIHRRFSITAQVETPVTATRATPLTSDQPADGSHVRVTPGLVGVGVELPFTQPTAFFVPRLGASVGAAWIHATKTRGTLTDGFGSVLTQTTETSDTAIAPAGWLTASASFLLIGPVRASLHGLLGATAGEITIRNQGIASAKWGLPIAGFGGRVELLLP